MDSDIAPLMWYSIANVMPVFFSGRHYVFEDAIALRFAAGNITQESLHQHSVKAIFFHPFKVLHHHILVVR